MADVDLTELAIILQDTLTRVDNLVFTTGAPSAELGTINSVALDVVAKVLYGPKTAAGWGPGTLLTGADGRDPEFRTSGGYLQVRLVGDTAWQNLIPIADLPEGPPGPTPVISIGTVTTAPTGDPAGASFTGTAAEPVLNLTLPRGGSGLTGANGWTAVEANVVDGARRVKQIVDWVGGTGVKPATGKFIGPAGLVDTAAEATDMRGAGGAGSGDMLAANNLSDLTDKAAARTTLVVYSKGETDTALAAKADLVGGMIPLAQIPATAITDTFVVTSQAAMLALTAERGDVAIRSDLSKSFILQAEPATTLANWKELLAPTVVVPVFATVAEVWAGSVTDKIIPPSVLNAAMEPQAIAVSAGNLAINGNNGINFTAAFTANTTIPNPTNKKPGRTSVVSIALTGGPWTTSLGSDFKKYAKSDAIPTAANAKFDLILTFTATDVFYSVLVKS